MSVMTDRLLDGYRPEAETALALAECRDFETLRSIAESIRDRSHGSVITYSPKVFIPLTQLCRDVCHYCTFAKLPKYGASPYLALDQVLEIARAGVAAGCHEALFTLGDKPELRYSVAREALAAAGHTTTLSYLAEIADRVHAETGLLPHINAGVMGSEELQALRRVSVSQGLMLESSSMRLCGPGGPHFGSPDKVPARRLAMIAAAGELKIPFTSGILIGIGETRRERIEALLALRELSDAYGHLQEIIIQNFRRKPGTKMAEAEEPSIDDLCWTIAVARIILGAEANIQAPPNLSPHSLRALIRAGINDLGGVSPVTPDHVNPEAPWPHLRLLAREAEAAGKLPVPRLAIYPSLVQEPTVWLDPSLQQSVRDRVDSTGFPRTDNWSPGLGVAAPRITAAPSASQMLHFLNVKEPTRRASGDLA